MRIITPMASEIASGGKERVSPRAGGDEVYLADDFDDYRKMGTVVGSQATSGNMRRGVDREKVLSVDNRALRIAPLIEAGFGRAGISYGPFPVRAGIAFAVHILNGHNTAQAEELPDTLFQRMKYWLAGCEVEPRWLRAIQWAKSGRVRRGLRQFRCWKRTAKNSLPVAILNENLAVGWFPAEVVADPEMEGNSFIMHALGPENGELRAGRPECRTRALRGVQNLPLYLVGILREQGMVYYVSSVEGAPGMAANPHYSPVAIERSFFPEKMYLGIHQGVLGQIGWRLDTRVRGVRVAQVHGYDRWYGGAHAADTLTGEGGLDRSVPESGDEWRVVQGAAARSADGASGSGKVTIAVLYPPLSTGLMHAEVSLENDEDTKIGLVWRFLDERNHWRIELSAHASEVVLISEGERMVKASNDQAGPVEALTHRLQVLDTGKHAMAYVDGEPVDQTWITDATFANETGIGFLLGKGDQADGGRIRRFEAHPRKVALPESLNMGAPWLRTGNRVVMEDDFDGAAGDIDGRRTPVGSRRWSRLIGTGIIETTGNSAARIRGSVQKPCPGRTAYCLDWVKEDFADLEVTVTPPGTQRGEGERSIAGFIVYQDPGNYMTLNVWRTDSYGGASISTFFKIDGFEDIYDAIWTNVGDRISYGRPSRLKLCCDGDQYIVFVNGEPVLYRAFKDVYPDFSKLGIRKIGLLANWEFGTDTGSRFEKFQARI
jgi:hypothetical protein